MNCEPTYRLRRAEPSRGRYGDPLRGTGHRTALPGSGEDREHRSLLRRYALQLASSYLNYNLEKKPQPHKPGDVEIIRVEISHIEKKRGVKIEILRGTIF